MKNIKQSFIIIFVSFIVAGVLDGIAAVIILGKMNFSSVWKFVASGFFGLKAFEGKSDMVIYGLSFHFFIAFIWTVIYYFIFRKIRFFKSNKIVGGLIYGILIWVIMNLAILPLTNIPKSPTTLKGVLIGMAILMSCVGLPISLLSNLKTMDEKTTNR